MEVSVAGRKLCIALPSYDGKVPLEWMTAFIGTQNLLHKYGVSLDFISLKGSALVYLSRNELVYEFLKTDATDILFIDTSQLWEPNHVLRLLALTTIYDCVGAPCSSNSNDPKFWVVPVRENDEIIKDANGIIRAWRCSVSFMMLKRKALEYMIERYKDLYYYPEGATEKKYALFNPELIRHRCWGEDMAFCNRYTDIGGEIWVDPYIKTKRAGTIIYEHDYLKCLEEEDEPRELLQAR